MGSGTVCSQNGSPCRFELMLGFPPRGLVHWLWERATSKVVPACLVRLLSCVLKLTAFVEALGVGYFFRLELLIRSLRPPRNPPFSSVVLNRASAVIRLLEELQITCHMKS